MVLVELKSLDSYVRFVVHLSGEEARCTQTAEFEDWLKEQTPKLRTIIQARLDLVSVGHFGNHKRFEGLIELKWLNGTRVYSFLWGNSIVVALYGGNKNAQNRDIKKAKKIRDEILEGTRTVHK